MKTNSKSRRRPDAERSVVRLAAGDPGSSVVELEGGGWTFEAIAQVYDTVNDHLMLFAPGSGTKTVDERVRAGRVKIHDGHPYAAGPSSTLGVVLEAEERSVGAGRGLWYKGRLSADAGSVATKLREGIIDENSLELVVLRESRAEVPIDRVPPQARRWCEMSPAGLAIVRRIDEWMWKAIGLVSDSSQGVRALLCPRVTTYADLPVSAALAWDPEGAVVRLAAYGSTPERRNELAGAFVLRALGGGAIPYRVPIADVVDGELVVVRQALEDAYARLAAEPSDVAVVAARHLARYEARLTSGANGAQDSAGTEDGEDAEVAPAATPPEPATSDPEDAPPTGPVGSPEPQPPSATATGEAAEAALRAHRLRQLQLDALRAEIGA